MDTDYRDELGFAMSIAAEVSEYVRAEYAAFEIIPNAPVTISTHVDHEVQERIIKAIREVFPSDAFVGEENTPTAKLSPASERRWVIDPIDGTRGFAQKTGEFSIMIGFTIDDRVVLGVVAEPVQNRITYAVAGQGCFVQVNSAAPRRCTVKTTRSLKDAVMVQSRTKEGHGPNATVKIMQPASVVEVFSAGVKLAMVARGEVDYYANDYSNFNDWDICAGDILVTEAGGQVSLFNGQPIAYGSRKLTTRRGIVASSASLHPSIIDRLAHLAAK